MVYNRDNMRPRGASTGSMIGSAGESYESLGKVGELPQTATGSLIMQAQGLKQGPRADLPPQPLKTPAPYMGRRQKRQMNTMLGQLMGDYATDLANGRDLLGTTTLLGS